MALTKLTTELKVHQTLADRPNQTDGLTPATLKAKYDQPVEDIKFFINETLTAEIDENFTTKDEITTTRKLDETGDFTGTINGLRPTQVDPYVSAKVEEHTSQLAEIPNKGFLKFLEYLQSGQATKIKLIGDSITAGQGATGYDAPDTNPVIYNDGTSIFYEGNYTCRSWANFFREYIVANFPTIQFENAGIGGKSAKWCNLHKTDWVKTGNDVVFVMLGTNDRWECTSIAEFKSKLTELLAYIKLNCNLMVVMTATPTLNDFADDAGTTQNPTYYFGMKEIDRVITDVCMENNYVHISHYLKLLDYARVSKTNLKSLLEGRTVGSHPIDAGHFVMWQNLQQALGIIDNTISFNNNAIPSAYFSDDNKYTSTDAITTFPKNKVTYTQIYSANTAGFPRSASGVLETYYTPTDGWQYQLYHVYNSTKVYKRNWINTGAWSPWIIINMVSYSVANAYTNASVKSDFPSDQITYTEISGGNATGFPENSIGMLETNILSSNNGYQYQLYHILNSSKVYKRAFTSGGVWSAWQLLNGTVISDDNGFTATSVLTDFPNKQISYTVISGANSSGFPSNLSGMLETYRLTSSNGWQYQLFHVYNSNSVYKRYWTNAGAWSAWEKISAV